MSQLDAVSEVDSQKATTPFGNGNVHKFQSTFEKQKEDPMTPREVSGSVQQLEPMAAMTKVKTQPVMST